MKKKFIYILSFLIILISLTGCSRLQRIFNPSNNDGIIEVPSGGISLEGPDVNYSVPDPNNPNGYKVTFDCNNGYKLDSTTTTNNTILEPNNPKKICSTFQYWCSDKELTKEFNFSTTVDKDTILYAKYYTDFAALTNEITSTVMKANVRIECEFYNNAMYGTVASSLGSGIIISADSNYYYCLTNNHVVYNPNNYRYSSFVVEDCFEEEYEATLIKRLDTYDLALLRFTKNTEEELEVITLADSEKDLVESEYVVALGEPLGQSNTITYGKILDLAYDFKPDEETLDESNVTFEVISHSAPINNGSSGGALLDTNLNLVGINFASAINNKTEEHVESYSIPITKVKEFLNEYL